MAESREAKAQALLIEEIQKRKQMENEVAVLSARLVEAEASASQADDMAAKASGFKQEILQLRSELGVAAGEAEAQNKFAKQCMEEGQAAKLELSRVNSELALAKSNEVGCLGIRVWGLGLGIWGLGVTSEPTPAKGHEAGCWDVL